MLNFFNKDIFNDKHELLVHGCNCFCTMGAGIAKEISKRYPGAYKADLATTRGDHDKLGDFTYYYDKTDDVWIVNLYTQFYYGRGTGGKGNFDFNAFIKGMDKLLKFLKSIGKSSISMPMIGCGLASSDEDRVKNEKLVSNHLKFLTDTHNININVYQI